MPQRLFDFNSRQNKADIEFPHMLKSLHMPDKWSSYLVNRSFDTLPWYVVSGQFFIWLEIEVEKLNVQIKLYIK